MPNDKNTAGDRPREDIPASVNSTEQLKAIIENMNSGVSVAAYGDKGEVRLAYANDRYYELFGYTREQFVTELKSPHDTLLPEDAEYAASMIGGVREGRGPATFKYRAVRRDGKTIVVRCSSSVSAIAGLSDRVLISIITDITDSVDAEQQRLVAA